MQIFIKNLSSRSLACEVEPGTSVADLKTWVERQEGVPSCSQSLVYAGKQLDDERLLSSYSIVQFSTVTLLLRLRGGKGGFGALLRGLGRDGSKTTNYDACRDLQGRRLRHKTSEEKLKEWNAQAKERELEKIALKHIKEQAKAAKREEQTQVEVESVVQAQKAVVNQVQSAVQDAIAAGAAPAGSVSTKRTGERALPSSKAAPPAKKPKMLAALETFGSEESELSDSDDE